MKISIARYPQLQLGHNALTKSYDQNNKAPKIKRHTHTQKLPWSIIVFFIHMNDSLQQLAHRIPQTTLHTPG